ncbi:hypothetical protein HMPREF1536_03005 [Parabacteroides gordonii MS-1 = DSM 23371]|mgnify:CR=1 FL=1|uniref:Uncharacterized protein n=1 Tax=Parabacteroides gordonii MS-1 = DSM 23371 TaxID=1203610 RepID=A0A0F5JCQ8_9BACT|nr:hypothetical protein HMPREF1536_03005 [Parabacteroides gordonii MS-1 = DSM 23371]
MTIFVILCILVAAILAVLLIKSVVNEIKIHITKETNRIIQHINNNGISNTIC